MLHDYGVHLHDDETAPYEDKGVHGEPAVFLLNEDGSLLYQQKQTSPYGRPNAEEFLKIAAYIKENLIN